MMIKHASEIVIFSLQVSADVFLDAVITKTLLIVSPVSHFTSSYQVNKAF